VVFFFFSFVKKDKLVTTIHLAFVLSFNCCTGIEAQLYKVLLFLQEIIIISQFSQDVQIIYICLAVIVFSTVIDELC